MKMKTVSSTARTRRTRVNFTAHQLQALEHVFQQTQYPDVMVIEKLASAMDLGIEKVLTWFQNRRSKFRRESKKGHVMWMRQQLFSSKSDSTAATNISKTAAGPAATAATATGPAGSAATAARTAVDSAAVATGPAVGSAETATGPAVTSAAIATGPAAGLAAVVPRTAVGSAAVPDTYSCHVLSVPTTAPTSHNMNSNSLMTTTPTSSIHQLPQHPPVYQELVYSDVTGALKQLEALSTEIWSSVTSSAASTSHSTYSDSSYTPTRVTYEPAWTTSQSQCQPTSYSNYSDVPASYTTNTTSYTTSYPVYNTAYPIQTPCNNYVYNYNAYQGIY